MKECIFNGIDEIIYENTLDNGIKVYLYPNNKTKNFYCSISVKYGAKYNKYKKNNKIYDIIPGSAHFLEHRLMIVGEDPIISKKLNSLGSLANAWTNYDGTNYNIYGSQNIEENIELLLDMFHKPTFNKKDIDEEKGIISEEIDMEKDQIGRYLFYKIYDNIFHNTYYNNTVIGEKEDINKITPQSLKRIYNDFYIPNNTFIVITGNFNKNNIMNYLTNYYKELNIKKKPLPKRIIEKEPYQVKANYEEIKKDMEDVRIKIAFKMKKESFPKMTTTELIIYLETIIEMNFSSSSELFERYKKENIMLDLICSAYTTDNFVLLIINSTTSEPKKLIDSLLIDIKKLYIDEAKFNRIIKKHVKSFILSFENAEDVEAGIVSDILTENKVLYDELNIIKNLSLKKAKAILNKIDVSNYTILRTIK